MKTSLFLGAALSALVVASAAMAADLPRRTAASPAPSYYSPTTALNWTGFYAGVNAGVVNWPSTSPARRCSASTMTVPDSMTGMNVSPRPASKAIGCQLCAPDSDGNTSAGPLS